MVCKRPFVFFAKHGVILCGSPARSKLQQTAGLMTLQYEIDEALEPSVTDVRFISSLVNTASRQNFTHPSLDALRTKLRQLLLSRALSPACRFSNPFSPRRAPVPLTESASAVRPQHLEVHIERRINRAASWRRSIGLCDATLWNACRAYAPGAAEAVLLLQVTLTPEPSSHTHTPRAHTGQWLSAMHTLTHVRTPPQAQPLRSRAHARCGWTGLQQAHSIHRLGVGCTRLLRSAPLSIQPDALGRLLRPTHICTGTVGSLPPPLHWDSLAPPTSAPELCSLHPHLHRDCAHCHCVHPDDPRRTRR